MATFGKTMTGLAAAGALAVSTIAPASAADRKGGIDAGEIVAGALVLGGIAAIAAAASNADDDYGYRHDRWGGRWGAGNSRAAVNQCVNAAENSASRYSYGRARVTDVRKVSTKRDGYNVSGRIALDGHGGGWGGGWRQDRYDNRYDTGTFTCKVRFGRVTDVDFSGLRGLR